MNFDQQKCRAGGKPSCGLLYFTYFSIESHLATLVHSSTWATWFMSSEIFGSTPGAGVISPNEITPLVSKRQGSPFSTYLTTQVHWGFHHLPLPTKHQVHLGSNWNEPLAIVTKWTVRLFECCSRDFGQYFQSA